jgi:predicted amidohydrolase
VNPPSPSSFRLALVQMLVEPGAVERNLARAERLVADAVQQGADVVLLPEALPFGWCDSSAIEAAEAVLEGAHFQAFRGWAMAHGIYLCAGLIERCGDRRFNAAVLIAPDGRLLLHHRKINELKIAHDLYAPGDRLNVAQTPLGCFGLMICADAFAKGEVISRTLGFMGAQVILSPCAWAVPPDHDPIRSPYGQLWIDSYGPVARDFGLWIAGASNVGWIRSGAWRGWKCIGCSLVVDSSGAAATKGSYGVDAEEIVMVTVSPVAREGWGEDWELQWKR